MPVEASISPWRMAVCCSPHPTAPGRHLAGAENALNERLEEGKMKTRVVLSILIAVLAAVAAATGLFWQTDGRSFEFQTLRGETVTIVGHGLYRYETASAATQGQAQDAVTLVIGIPLLLGAMFLRARGSLRGKLLLAGTLAYFLYTYMSYAFGAAYNPLFLIYVALFTLSLAALVLAVMDIDIVSLPSHFPANLPRRSIAAVLFAVGGFLLLAWSGRILPSLAEDRPPFGLESYTTLVIQVLDLGLIVPLAILAGVLLLGRTGWGYLLASVALIKGFTMGTAVSTMAFAILFAGEQVSLIELIVFPTLTVSIIALTVVLLKSVRERDVTSPSRSLTLEDTASR